MSDTMTDKSASTAAHAPPERPVAIAPSGALICAFPTSRAVALPEPGAVVGRDWLADRGLADSEVSAKHLAFVRKGALGVEDLGSRNGTWINGQHVGAGEFVAIDDGAILRLGRTLFIYRKELCGAFERDEPLGAMIGPFGLRSVRETIAAQAQSKPRNVLVCGETGTGKELAAAVVAARLGRSAPFAAVNMAGVAAGVFESQLFGHVAGAFSGAKQGARGVFAAHDGGTVFLDEIGELSLELQPKLLRLLENREILPVGAERAHTVDVLVIAATNRALDEMVEAGQFRRDLFARLAMAVVELPPLRDRPEDLPAILASLAERAGWSDGDEWEVEAVERLMLAPWRNNVRELQACFEQVRAADPRPGIRLWAVEQVLGKIDVAPVLTDDNIRAALAACDGNETRAARYLGISRGRLRRILAKRQNSSA